MITAQFIGKAIGSIKKYITKQQVISCSLDALIKFYRIPVSSSISANSKQQRSSTKVPNKEEPKSHKKFQ